MPNTIVDHLPQLLFAILACAMIAIGRLKIRRARKTPAPRKSLLGWALVVAGVLLLTTAVVFWDTPLH